MSRIYNYDPNLFYERQLLDPYYANNSKAAGGSRSYTHWTLYNTMPSVELDKSEKNEVHNGKRYDPNGLYPVISGIITDPTISVGITHSFGAPTGTVGQIMNTVSSTASEVSEAIQAGSAATSLIDSAFGGFIDEAVKGLTKKDKDGNEHNANLEGKGLRGLGNYIGDALSNGANKALNFGQNVVNKLKDTTVVTSMDYIKVFKGTTVQPSIPMLQTRLYHGIPMHSKDGVEILENKEEKIVKENLQVIKQLERLLDTFMGDMVAPSDGSTTVEDKINALVGLQKSPNHFRTEYYGLDNNIIAPGTFVLEYGDTIFKNLIVTGFNFTLSTINTPDSCLVSDGEDGVNGRNSYTGRARKGQYLYADISIHVEPSKYWSKKAIKSLIRVRSDEYDTVSFWDTNKSAH